MALVAGQDIEPGDDGTWWPKNWTRPGQIGGRP
jgi:hypothetical protein